MFAAESETLNVIVNLMQQLGRILRDFLVIIEQFSHYVWDLVWIVLHL